MKKKDELNVEQVMKVNRLLSSKKGIIASCVGTDILIVVVAQYLLNLALNVPAWVKDLEKPFRYIGINNIFFQWNHFKTFPGLHIGFYLLLIIALLVVDGMIVYKAKVYHAEDFFNVGQKGTARWTTNEEIKQQYKEIPDRETTRNKGGFDGAGGTIIYRIGNKLYIDQSATNNLIIGITRSGKGEMFVYPSIDVYSRAKEKTSLVITDPKLELYKSSKRTLEERGYDVYLLNLDDPLHSMGFNPLEQIKEEYLKKNYAEAELLAQSFSFSIFNPNSPTNTDAFWQDTASSLLTAMILAHVQDCIEEDEIINSERYKKYVNKREYYEGLSEEEKFEQHTVWNQLKQNSRDIIMESKLRGLPEEQEFFLTDENAKKITMYSIINTFTELARIKAENDPSISALDSYFSQRPPLDRVKLKYSAIEVAGDRTKGSIFASMLVKLTVFTFENVAKMTAESSLRLEDIGFGKKPIAVFLGIPDYDKSTHFLASVFIRQLTFVLEKKATRNMSGKCDRKVKFICDEFGNLPAIEGMENIITVCLGRNISYDLYIQAYKQLNKLYGDDAETIIGNCGNQIYILTNDDNTAENFSKNLGNETIIDVQRSGNKLSSNKDFMESTMEKPLLDMNKLMELKEGECVVKRVMKRQDLNHNRIRPTPIFNSEESGKRFLYRYEYLTDTFPNPDQIDLYQINQEDRSFINLRERVWDWNQSFYRIAQKQKGTQPTVDRLGDLKDKDMILNILRKFFSVQDMASVTEDTSVVQLINIIQKSNLKDSEKNQLISKIRMSNN